MTRTATLNDDLDAGPRASLAAWLLADGASALR